uniref:DUF4912 domain-containing protein n=1 Tax=Candidatus Laterigemmans baculatus TaxID=2770505 RepID=UPI0013DC00C8|nr:DUF4912 domain-containing protein [Candidatus Laterigemmans baculatus]
MITTADLKTQTRRDLAETARDHGVAGWHSMRKDELIEALRKIQRRSRRKAEAGEAAGGGKTVRAGKAEAGKSEAGKSEAGKRTTSAGRKAGQAKSAPSKTTPGKTTSGKTSQSKALQPSGKGTAATRSSGSKSEANRSRAGKPQVGKSQVGKARAGKAVAAKAASGKAAASKSGGTGKAAARTAERPATAPRVVRALRKQQAAADHRKDLSASVLVGGVAAKKASGQGQSRPNKDRIVLIVRDSYWLQASWEITRASVERARAAMGAHWHTAQPVLRLLEVAHGASANAAEQVIRDIPIHGGVSNWYIDVENPPSRFRVLIGYKATTGKVYTLCRSNVVQTPAPGACDPIDGHWQDIAEDYERIYALSDNENGTGSGDLREMFEERLRRPMSDPLNDNYGAGADLALHRERELPFHVDAELIVYGSTTPGATVTLAGEPVRLRSDGTFTVRMELPDRRQVLPVVACSRDGLRQRTTVVAVERNTKVMEPVSRNQMD